MQVQSRHWKSMPPQKSFFQPFKWKKEKKNWLKFSISNGNFQQAKCGSKNTLFVSVRFLGEKKKFFFQKHIFKQRNMDGPLWRPSLLPSCKFFTWWHVYVNLCSKEHYFCNNWYLFLMLDDTRLSLGFCLVCLGCFIIVYVAGNIRNQALPVMPR